RIGIEPTPHNSPIMRLFIFEIKNVYTASIRLKKLIIIEEPEWALPNSNVFFHYFDTFAVHDDNTLPNGDIIGKQNRVRMAVRQRIVKFLLPTGISTAIVSKIRLKIFLRNFQNNISRLLPCFFNLPIRR